MNLSRRNFLGAAAASPLAAKEMVKKAAEAASMEAAGISLHGDSLYTGVAGIDIDSPQQSLWEAVKKIGIPDWKRDDLRADARRSRTLDPDIAALKSLSMAAKMRKQWNRNYDTLIESALKQTEIERMKKLFFDKHPDISEW